MSELPTATYDGVIERTEGGGVIRFERRLPYSIRDVWDAVTNPERLADWWLPFDADVTVDLREGGEMVFSARGDEPMEITCSITRVEAPMLLEHTHVDEGAFLRWELEPVADGCVLRLSHFVTNPDDAIGNCYIVGLHTSLSRLEPVLAGNPILWDWEAFAEAQSQYAVLGFAPEVEES